MQKKLKAKTFGFRITGVAKKEQTFLEREVCSICICKSKRTQALRECNLSAINLPNEAMTSLPRKIDFFRGLFLISTAKTLKRQSLMRVFHPPLRPR
jgi:hypothetical protein